MTPEVDDYAAMTGGSVAGLNYYGSSLLLKSETSLRVYFELTDGSIEDYIFDVDDVEVTPTKKNEKYYYVEIPNLGADDLNALFMVTVTGNDGEMSVMYGPMSYVYSALNGANVQEGLAAVATALYNYNQYFITWQTSTKA